MSLEASVKIEPDWDEGDLEDGVSEAASLVGLYEGHQVKNELVVGPEMLQQRDIAYSNYFAVDGLQVEICKQEIMETGCPEIQTSVDFEGFSLEIIDQFDSESKVTTGENIGKSNKNNKQNNCSVGNVNE